MNLKKCISVLLLILILSENIFANSLYFKSYANNNSNYLKNSGYIIDSFKGTSSQKIYCIQTLHANPSAQKSICDILSILKNIHKDSLKIVGIEGSYGNIDTSLISSIPNKKIKKKLIDQFLNKGKLHGAELYDILNPNQIYLYGLEDKNLYIKNFQTFYNVFTKRNFIANWFNSYNEITEYGKEILYPNTLKKIEQKEALYNNGSITFFMFLDYLIFSAHTNHIDINKNYPAIRKYIIYKNNLNIICNEFNLCDETNKLLFQIKKHILINRPQALQLCESSLLLNNLYNYLMNNSSWYNAYYWKQNENKFFEEYMKILNKLYPEKLFIDPKIKSLINNMDIFYNDIEKRNEIMLNNLIRYSNEFDSKISVIITGGFHTSGITNILKAKGISYVVISPNIKNTKNFYRERLIEQSNILLPKINISPEKLELMSMFLEDKFDNELITRFQNIAKSYLTINEIQLMCDQMNIILKSQNKKGFKYNIKKSDKNEIIFTISKNDKKKKKSNTTIQTVSQTKRYPIEKIDTNILLLDLKTASEFLKNSIPPLINLLYDQIEFTFIERQDASIYIEIGNISSLITKQLKPAILDTLVKANILYKTAKGIYGFRSCIRNTQVLKEALLKIHIIEPRNPKTSSPFYIIKSLWEKHMQKHLFIKISKPVAILLTSIRTIKNTSEINPYYFEILEQLIECVHNAGMAQDLNLDTSSEINLILNFEEKTLQMKMQGDSFVQFAKILLEYDNDPRPDKSITDYIPRAQDEFLNSYENRTNKYIDEFVNLVKNNNLTDYLLQNTNKVVVKNTATKRMNINNIIDRLNKFYSQVQKKLLGIHIPFNFKIEFLKDILVPNIQVTISCNNNTYIHKFIIFPSRNNHITTLSPNSQIEIMTGTSLEIFKIIEKYLGKNIYTDLRKLIIYSCAQVLKQNCCYIQMDSLNYFYELFFRLLNKNSNLNANISPFELCKFISTILLNEYSFFIQRNVNISKISISSWKNEFDRIFIFLLHNYPNGIDLIERKYLNLNIIIQPNRIWIKLYNLNQDTILQICKVLDENKRETIVLDIRNLEDNPRYYSFWIETLKLFIGKEKLLTIYKGESFFANKVSKYPYIKELVIFNARNESISFYDIAAGCDAMIYHETYDCDETSSIMDPAIDYNLPQKNLDLSKYKNTLLHILNNFFTNNKNSNAQNIVTYKFLLKCFEYNKKFADKMDDRAFEWLLYNILILINENNKILDDKFKLGINNLLLEMNSEINKKDIEKLKYSFDIRLDIILNFGARIFKNFKFKADNTFFEKAYEKYIEDYINLVYAIINNNLSSSYFYDFNTFLFMIYSNFFSQSNSNFIEFVKNIYNKLKNNLMLYGINTFNYQIKGNLNHIDIEIKNSDTNLYLKDSITTESCLNRHYQNSAPIFSICNTFANFHKTSSAQGKNKIIDYIVEKYFSYYEFTDIKILKNYLLDIIPTICEILNNSSINEKSLTWELEKQLTFLLYIITASYASLRDYKTFDAILYNFLNYMLPPFWRLRIKNLMSINDFKAIFTDINKILTSKNTYTEIIKYTNECLKKAWNNLTKKFSNTNNEHYITDISFWIIFEFYSSYSNLLTLDIPNSSPKNSLPILAMAMYSLDSNNNLYNSKLYYFDIYFLINIFENFKEIHKDYTKLIKKIFSIFENNLNILEFEFHDLNPENINPITNSQKLALSELTNKLHEQISSVFSLSALTPNHFRETLLLPFLADYHVTIDNIFYIVHLKKCINQELSMYPNLLNSRFTINFHTTYYLNSFISQFAFEKNPKNEIIIYLSENTDLAEEQLKNLLIDIKYNLQNLTGVILYIPPACFPSNETNKILSKFPNVPIVIITSNIESTTVKGIETTHEWTRAVNIESTSETNQNIKNAKEQLEELNKQKLQNELEIMNIKKNILNYINRIDSSSSSNIDINTDFKNLLNVLLEKLKLKYNYIPASLANEIKQYIKNIIKNTLFKSGDLQIQLNSLIKIISPIFEEKKDYLLLIQKFLSIFPINLLVNIKHINETILLRIRQLDRGITKKELNIYLDKIIRWLDLYNLKDTLTEMFNLLELTTLYKNFHIKKLSINKNNNIEIPLWHTLLQENAQKNGYSLLYSQDNNISVLKERTNIIISYSITEILNKAMLIDKTLLEKIIYNIFIYIKENRIHDYENYLKMVNQNLLQIESCNLNSQTSKNRFVLNDCSIHEYTKFDKSGNPTSGKVYGGKYNGKEFIVEQNFNVIYFNNGFIKYPRQQNLLMLSESTTWKKINTGGFEVETIITYKNTNTTIQTEIYDKEFNFCLGTKKTILNGTITSNQTYQDLCLTNPSISFYQKGIAIDSVKKIIAKYSKYNLKLNNKDCILEFITKFEKQLQVDEKTILQNWINQFTYIHAPITNTVPYNTQSVILQEAQKKELNKTTISTQYQEEIKTFLINIYKILNINPAPEFNILSNQDLISYLLYIDTCILYQENIISKPNRKILKDLINQLIEFINRNITNPSEISAILQNIKNHIKQHSYEEKTLSILHKFLDYLEQFISLLNAEQKAIFSKLTIIKENFYKKNLRPQYDVLSKKEMEILTKAVINPLALVLKEIPIVEIQDADTKIVEFFNFPEELVKPLPLQTTTPTNNQDNHYSNNLVIDLLSDDEEDNSSSSLETTQKLSSSEDLEIQKFLEQTEKDEYIDAHKKTADINQTEEALNRLLILPENILVELNYFLNQCKIFNSILPGFNLIASSFGIKNIKIMINKTQMTYIDTNNSTLYINYNLIALIYALQKSRVREEQWIQELMHDIINSAVNNYDLKFSTPVLCSYYQLLETLNKYEVFNDENIINQIFDNDNGYEECDLLMSLKSWIEINDRDCIINFLSYFPMMKNKLKNLYSKRPVLKNTYHIFIPQNTTNSIKEIINPYIKNIISNSTIHVYGKILSKQEIVYLNNLHIQWYWTQDFEENDRNFLYVDREQIDGLIKREKHELNTYFKKEPIDITILKNPSIDIHILKELQTNNNDIVDISIYCFKAWLFTMKNINQLITLSDTWLIKEFISKNLYDTEKKLLSDIINGCSAIIYIVQDKTVEQIYNTHFINQPALNALNYTLKFIKNISNNQITPSININAINAKKINYCV
jgi:hypothetical protein